MSEYRGKRWYREIYLTSEHWQRKRRSKLEQQLFACEYCGSNHNLQVHHLHYHSLWAEELRDLRLLCGDCHFMVHHPDTWDGVKAKIENWKPHM